MIRSHEALLRDKGSLVSIWAEWNSRWRPIHPHTWLGVYH